MWNLIIVYCKQYLYKNAYKFWTIQIKMKNMFGKRTKLCTYLISFWYWTIFSISCFYKNLRRELRHLERIANKKINSQHSDKFEIYFENQPMDILIGRRYQICIYIWKSAWSTLKDEIIKMSYENFCFFHNLLFYSLSRFCILLIYI